MKPKLLTLALILAFSSRTLTAQVLTAQETEVAEEALSQAAVDRMNYLESVHGIKFDRTEFCGAYLGIPEGEDRSFEGEYIPNKGSVYLNSRFTLQLTRVGFYLGERAFLGVPRLSKNPFIVVLLDHELGHALADHVSRRIGNGIWPNHEKLRKSAWHTICGTRVVSEGIGEFFGYSVTDYKKKKNGRNLPVHSDIQYWNSDGSMEGSYTGGYWLVEPILKKYGERGLEYLVTHPLDFPDGKTRQAAKEYQKKALAELERTK